MSDFTQLQNYFQIGSGIATHIDYDFEYATKDEIDALVYVTIGERNPSPVMLKTLSLPPTNDELTKLGTLILALYKNKWDKLKAVYKLQYDPIHNYEDTFTEKVNDATTNTGSETSNSSDNRTASGTDTKTRTDNLSSTGSDSNTEKTTSTGNDSTFGFNSSSAVATDADSKEVNASGTTTSSLSNTGTQKNEEVSGGTDNSIKAGSLSKSYSIKNDVAKESKHTGNIGNLTTQQLVKQEIELWKWNYVESIVADLKSFLTLPIYCS